METGQSDKLELIPHLAQFLLEGLDGPLVQLLAQVDRGRAVIRQQFTGEAGVDRLGEAAGLVDIRLRGFAPDHVGVGSIGEAACDGRVESTANSKEALD